MKLAGTIIVVASLTAAGIAASPLTATEIPPSERRSGYTFMAPDTKAMQDDDTANPGMLWVLDGEALWKKKAGTSNKACADCHDDARVSMKGVAARYPAFDKSFGRPVNLEQRINLCRARHQAASPFTYESRDLLALTAFVAEQSRGGGDCAGQHPRTGAIRCEGARLLHAPTGAAQSRMHQLPRRQLGRASGRIRGYAGVADRLSNLSAGMAVAGIAATTPAQLHHGDAGTKL